MDLRGIGWLFLVAMIVCQPERTGTALRIFWTALIGN